MSMDSGNGRKQRLELTWIGKDERTRLEPRILLPVSEYSHAKGKPGDGNIHDNILINGDNLLALKSLLQQFAGKVKCIYIDPPYNTGQALVDYDDGLEHSLWLSLMRERLSILRDLLAPDGTIFCQLNDDEMAYAKVLMDEVFGRGNFINQVSVRMKQTAGASGGGEDKRLRKNIEYILVYAKDQGSFVKFNDVMEEEDLFEMIADMREAGKSWKYTRVIRSLGTRHQCGQISDGSGNPIKVFNHEGVVTQSIGDIMQAEQLSERQAYEKYFDAIFRDTNAQSSIRTRVLEFPAASAEFVSIDYVPNSGRSKGKLSTVYYKGRNRDQIAWLKDVAVRRGGRLVKLERIGTYWEGFPLNNLTKEGGVQFPNGKKPEALIRRVLELASNSGDLVLDSFAGSGTTGAVAQKMGRRWIMIELGEHATTHVVPRLKRVIDGQDSGGITELTGWKGGGGFRFYRLAPSLIETDQFGQQVISKLYNAAMLSEAMCKHMGFNYAPSQDPALYWQQGRSSERDFIFVTTQSLTYDALKALSLEVGEDRTLLVCCKAFRARLSDFPNLTVKKIPQAVLHNCEWGRDDYSLNIAKSPEEAAVDPDGGPDDDGNGSEPTPRRRSRADRHAEPAAEAQAAPIKKAPLKMDGTTRGPKAAKQPVRTVASATLRAQSEPEPIAETVNGPKPAGRPLKSAKPNAVAKGRPATKAGRATAIPTTKPRRAADGRQGRLL
jgi:adenine-specific DNA-methyltransferase